MAEEEKRDPRDAIDVIGLILALQAHAIGSNKMSATQVSAAIALLKKTLPDLPGAAASPPEDEKQKAHEAALRELE